MYSPGLSSCNENRVNKYVGLLPIRKHLSFFLKILSLQSLFFIGEGIIMQKFVPYIVFFLDIFILCLPTLKLFVLQVLYVMMFIFWFRLVIAHITCTRIHHNLQFPIESWLQLTYLNIPLYFLFLHYKTSFYIVQTSINLNPK